MPISTNHVQYEYVALDLARRGQPLCRLEARGVIMCNNGIPDKYLHHALA